MTDTAKMPASFDNDVTPAAIDGAHKAEFVPTLGEEEKTRQLQRLSVTLRMHDI